MGPGILATAVTGCITALFLFPPIGSFAFAFPNDLTRWGVAIAIGVVTSLLAETLHMARMREVSRIKELEAARLKSHEIELALRRENEKNKALLRNASDGVHILDINGNIVEASDSFCSMLGYTRQEIIGMNVCQWDAGFLDDEEKFRVVRQQFEKQHRSQFETRHLHKNGHIIDVEVSGFPVLIDGQKLLFNIARDITDRKHGEYQARKASLYARSLIEASLDPLVTISPQGKIQDVNQATEIITGLSRADLIGSDFSDYFTDPDNARAAYQKVFLESQVTDYPLSIRHVSGKITDVLYNASLYRNENGEVEGVFAAARDVTERNRVDLIARQYEAIVNSSEDAIIGKSLDGLITSWNLGAEHMFGYPAEEMLGQPIVKLIPESLHQEEQQILERLSQGISIDHYETKHICKDGKTIDVSVRISPILNMAGKVIGASKIARDITQQKLAEAALKDREYKLRLFIEHTPLQVAMFDREMRYIAASRHWLKDFHLDTQKIVGQCHYQVFPYLIPEHWKVAHRRGLAGEVVRNDEDCFVNEAGERTWLRWEVRPWGIDNAAPEGIIIFSEDITERKLAEDELKRHRDHLQELVEEQTQSIVERERLLSTVMDVIPVGLWILDKQGTSISINDTVKQIWGGFKSVDAKHYGEYKAWWVSSGKPIAPEEWAASRALQHGETSLNEVIEIEAFDGCHKIILNSCVPLLDKTNKSPVRWWSIRTSANWIMPEKPCSMPKRRLKPPTARKALSWLI